MTFSFQTAGSIIAGTGCRQSIAEHLRTWDKPVRRVLMITSPSIRRSGVADSLRQQLLQAGIASDLLDCIRPEPEVHDIEQWQTRVSGEGYGAYIGLGGGSVLDAAKLMAVLATNKKPLETMIGIDKIENDGIPAVLVPTTSGTGSEVTPNAIVTVPERQLKTAVVSRRLYPKLAVLDPELTLTLPKEVTAATGMDAFTHALESFIGRKANPISDMFALESIRLISGSILEAWDNGSSIDARSRMLYGSAYGGMALAASGTAAVHALAYPLGGNFGVPHGVANAMLLPHVMEAQLDAIAGRLAQAAAAMRQGPGIADRAAAGTGHEAEWALNKIADWTRQIGIPDNLAEFGVTESDIPSLAENASRVTRLMDNNPKAFNLTDLARIYRKLLP